MGGSVPRGGGLRDLCPGLLSYCPSGAQGRTRRKPQDISAQLCVIDFMTSNPTNSFSRSNAPRLTTSRKEVIKMRLGPMIAIHAR